MGLGTEAEHNRFEGTALYQELFGLCDMDVEDNGGCKALSAEKYYDILNKKGLSQYAKHNVTNYIPLEDAINTITTLIVRKQGAEVRVQRQALEDGGQKPSLGA